MLKDRLIPIRTLGEETLQRLKHFKRHDVFSMTSYGPVTSSVMWSFDQALATSYTSSIETKPVSRLVCEIFNFKYYITSWRHHWRHVTWINYPCGSRWKKYAVDDYVKRWSNSLRIRNCQRNNMLKVVTSRLWRYSQVKTFHFAR